MKKIIHIEDHRGCLVCDDCGYTLPEGAVTWGPHLIGYECPECAANMLTQRDYDDSETMQRVVAWINKVFGWLGTESPPTEADGFHEVSVRNHNGELIIKPTKE